MARLVFTGDEFIFSCSFEERKIPKRAGFLFRFEGARIVWFTPYPSVAIRLRDYGDVIAKTEIDRMTIRHSPYLGSLPYPKSLVPLPFQKEIAAPFALSRNKSYLALDPGLGKSIVAALIQNALRTLSVVICPAFLTRNLEFEFTKWSTWRPKIGRLEYGKEVPKNPDILIVPDTIIHRGEARDEIRKQASWADTIGKPSLLIVDEAHRYKGDKSQRTIALLGSSDDAREVRPGIHTWFDIQSYMSGTPMPNRPIELHPMLSRVAPETIDYMSREEYGKHYCGGYYDGYGYNFDGHSNLVELRKKVHGTFMLRLKKSDVLKDLPPKTEEMVILGDLPPRLIPMDRKILSQYSPDDLVSGLVKSDHIATYRKELGKYKVKSAVTFLKELLNDTDEKVVVFAYHKEVIAALTAGLMAFQPLVITGGTDLDKRNFVVNEFQKNKKRRVFIGNYVAAGIGLTLTAASRVVMVEFDWVPSTNDQASDRVHRIGQLDNVLVQYLLYENSLDKKIMFCNFKKKGITAHI